MAITKTTGLQIAIATGYGASKNMTAVSNASEGVATLESSHGVAVNDIIELTSGWKYIDGRLVRAKAVATNDVTLEGVDTQSTTFFPALEGVGTVREVSGWQRITGIVAGSFQPSGGGFGDIPATESDDVREKVVPGLARAVSLDFKFHYPPAAAWRTYVEAADSVIVGAFDGTAVIGASTGLPLAHEPPSLTDTFAAHGFTNQK